MKRFGWLIARYLIQAILPYFLFSWLLLTVILFVQQASRYADIFFSVNIPAQLVWQLTLALVPNVIAFTCPMAVLVGTIIGLSKMQGDSELVAIRAAGVANWQIIAPIALLGVALSVFAFLVNVSGVPFAAGIVRRVALQTAIKKLESPIEPGVFNSEVAGYTIYVRGGDIDTGKWTGIFISSRDEKSGVVRLITSGQGRVDVSNQNSELVLSDANSYTFPTVPGTGKFIAESIGELRLAIKTRRNELIQRLGSAEITPEELGLNQLTEYAAAREGKERTEAEILWQRRILLSITPLIFCILGASMILRFNRGGRGFGVFIALVGLITYYLLAFLGEQLARTGKVSVAGGGLIPIILSATAIIWLSFSGRFRLRIPSMEYFKRALPKIHQWSNAAEGRGAFLNLTTGIRDLDLVFNLIRYFFLSLAFLSAIFLIFTAFELWKFAGRIENGVQLLTQYLFFLLPFVYVQLAPSAAMISILATYVIKSRQNEIVTWTAAGQSVYRLLFPSFVLMAVLGFLNWQIQENILPNANRTQEQLRNQIRNLGVAKTDNGRTWFALGNRIYSFTLNPDKSQEGGRQSGKIRSVDADFHSASDNESGVSDVDLYEFSNEGKLQTVYRSATARWNDEMVRLDGPGEKSSLKQGSLVSEPFEHVTLSEQANPFGGTGLKPNQMDSRELRERLAISSSNTERLSFNVVLQKKYSTLLLPLVICLFTAPFSLSLSRRSRAVAVGYAVVVWLMFTGSMSAFEQLGLNGNLDPRIAIWGPLTIFSLLGLYFLTKIRT
jgi:LPS export ABC transporter permease LptF